MQMGASLLECLTVIYVILVENVNIRVELPLLHYLMSHQCDVDRF